MQKRGSCPYAYWVRDTIHCQIQKGRGGKWDFCKHQYFCRLTNRHELAENAAACNLNGKEGKP